MITKIEAADDVKAFAKQLISEGVSFHPDDDFKDYVYFKTGKPFYTRKQAHERNKVMDKCFSYCEKSGVDIYSLMLEVTLVETGWDKFIPLPSQPYPDNN